MQHTLHFTKIITDSFRNVQLVEGINKMNPFQLCGIQICIKIILEKNNMTGSVEEF